MIELKSDAIYETVTTFKPALHGLKLRGGILTNFGALEPYLF